MLGDALTKCTKALLNRKFDPDRGFNPFSYFNMIANHEFVHRIKVEKKHFDMVLSAVQEVSREQVKRYEGEIQDVLVEELNEHEEGFVTGRLSNNTLVHFKGEAELIGKIVKVKLNKCQGFYYMGEQV